MEADAGEDCAPDNAAMRAACSTSYKCAFESSHPVRRSLESAVPQGILEHEYRTATHRHAQRPWRASGLNSVRPRSPIRRHDPTVNHGVPRRGDRSYPTARCSDGFIQRPQLHLTKERLPNKLPNKQMAPKVSSSAVTHARAFMVRTLRVCVS